MRILASSERAARALELVTDLQRQLVEALERVGRSRGADRPFVAMTADSVTAGEGEGAVQVTVQRFGSGQRALGFTWWTEAGSARPGSDYAEVEARSAAFLPGEGRVRLVVPLVDDPVPEGPESFSLRVRVDRPGADPGFVATTITVIDDDTPAADR